MPKKKNRNSTDQNQRTQSTNGNSRGGSGGGFGAPANSYKTSYSGGSAPQQANTSRYDGGGGGIGAPQQSNKSRFEGGGGFGAPQQSNKSRYDANRESHNNSHSDSNRGFGLPNYTSRSSHGPGSGFGAADLSKPAWGSKPAWTNASRSWDDCSNQRKEDISTSTQDQQFNYNPVDDVDDWGESGFVVESTSAKKAVVDAPLPVVNVWQQRMDFYQAAVPGSLDEEERMLQAALEMSRIEDEKDKLRLTLEEEELASSLHAEVNRPESDSIHSIKSQYPDCTIEDPWPATPSVVSELPNAKCKTSDLEEPDNTKAPGFQRGIGRGNMNRGHKKSSDTSSEVSFGDEVPISPPQLEPRSLPRQLKQFQSIAFKEEVKVDNADALWDSDPNCEDMDNVKKEVTLDSVMQHQTSLNSDKSTLIKNNENENAAHSKEPEMGSIRQIADITMAHTTSSNKLLDTASVPDKTPAASRPIRRQYGPRARGRKAASVANISKLPIVGNDSLSQPVLKAIIPEARFYIEEDTTAKLMDLCNITKKSLNEKNQDLCGESVFNKLSVADSVNTVPEIKPACDSPQSLVQSPVISTGFSMLPRPAEALGIRKHTALATSELKSMPSEAVPPNKIEDLRSHLGGLGLGGNIWSQYFMNVPWGTGMNNDVIPSTSQHVSGSSSESDLTPNRSPMLPPDYGEKDKPHNLIGNVEIGSFLGYSNPYMNMYMPQTYGMGYPNLHVAPTVGLRQPTVGNTGDNSPSQIKPNMQMPGIMPYGLLPGVMPHMNVSGTIGQGMPAVTGHGIPNMAGHGIPNMAGQVSNRYGQDMTSLSAQGIPEVPGQQKADISVQENTSISVTKPTDITAPKEEDVFTKELPGESCHTMTYPIMSPHAMPGGSGHPMSGSLTQTMPGMTAPAFPGISAQMMSGQTFPGMAAQPGQMMPGMSGQGMFNHSCQTVPGLSGPGMLGQSSQTIPGPPMQRMQGSSMPATQGASIHVLPNASSQMMSTQAVITQDNSGQTMQGLLQGTSRQPLSGHASMPTSGPANLGLSGQVMPVLSGQMMPIMHAQVLPSMSQPIPGHGQHGLHGMFCQPMSSVGQVAPIVPEQPMSNTSGQPPQEMTGTAIANVSNPLGIPPGLQLDAVSSKRPNAQNSVPSTAASSVNSQTSNIPWEGSRLMNGLMNEGMLQYGLPFLNDSNVHRPMEQAADLSSQSTLTHPMPMMPGRMPFLPTMPLLPQQYNNVGYGQQEVANYPSQYNIKHVD